MRVLVLCPDRRPENANPEVSYYPISPTFAGTFVDAFCKALDVIEAHTIAFGRDFEKDETNVFIFNRVNEYRRAMFKNNGADWVICLESLMVNGPSGNYITIISEPMYISGNDTKQLLTTMTQSLPGSWNSAYFSEFSYRFEDEIAYYREENFRLKDKISKLNRELDMKKIGGMINEGSN